MTLRRLAEGAMSTVLDAAPDGILLVEADGRIAYVNQAACELFGYAGDELVGEPIERLVPGRLRGRHVRDRTAYSEQPRPRPMGLGLELRGVRRDATEVPVEISLAPVESEHERGTVAIVRDATMQRKLEQDRLRYAESHAVEEIVSALDAIVWESTTPDRESLTDLGGRQEMLLGYPGRSGASPASGCRLVHPDDRLTALSFGETAREKESFELTYRVIAADGAVREVRDIVA